MGSEGWFSTGEACAALGISRTTLLAAEADGVLAPVRTPGGHRRYPAAALQRYLGTAPLRARPGPAPEQPRGPVVDAETTRTVRDAVRPVARVLDAECAGLYLTGPDGGWRFAGATGVPRWLATRLAADPAPAPVTSAAGATSAQLFEPAAEGFPDGRSAGHGVATRVRADGTLLGTLFLVTRAGHLPLPAELRTLDAAADLLGHVVAQLVRVAELRDRLDRIGALCEHVPGGA